MLKLKNKIVKLVTVIFMATVMVFSFTGCNMLGEILGSLTGGGSKYNASDSLDYFKSQGYDGFIAVGNKQALEPLLGGVQGTEEWLVASKDMGSIGSPDYYCLNIIIYFFKDAKTCEEQANKLKQYIIDYEGDDPINFATKGNMAYYGDTETISLLDNLK